MIQHSQGSETCFTSEFSTFGEKKLISIVSDELTSLLTF